MMDVETDYDVVVVGAGFAGLYALYRLRTLGFTVRVIEAGDDVGGTWYWNRYPGARCDVESLDYSFSFDEALQQEWKWTERYSAQPEILAYIRHVADRFDLRQDIEFGTRVESATLEESTRTWTVQTDTGRTLTARSCIMATGMLSVGRMPEIAGIDDFQGTILHTGAWPMDGIDLSGKRVAVIGTGSSGIQAIPEIAKTAGHLTVFQRTPHFSVPARNAPLDPQFQEDFKLTYSHHRELARNAYAGTLKLTGDQSALEVPEDERARRYEAAWESGGSGILRLFRDLFHDVDANATAAEFVRQKIRTIVEDPQTAEALSPSGYPIGTKRIALDTNYYETFTRRNVKLVGVRGGGIERITPTGVATPTAEHDFDVIVFATGFDAMTGALLKMDIRGRGGLPLREKWAAGPRTYLGVSSAGFPNLFFVTGPGSPSVLANMVMAIEQHIEWITEALEYLRKEDLETMEPRLDAEDAWVEHVNELAAGTLFPIANSWYLGANVPGKPRVFMPYLGGLGTYRAKCAEVAAASYEGFDLA